MSINPNDDNFDQLAQHLKIRHYLGFARACQQTRQVTNELSISNSFHENVPSKSIDTPSATSPDETTSLVASETISDMTISPRSKGNFFSLKKIGYIAFFALIAAGSVFVYYTSFAEQEPPPPPSPPPKSFFSRFFE